MTSHYPESLLKDYELLLSHFPSHVICRPHVAAALEEWRRTYTTTEPVNILEVGSGHGETTKLIMEAMPAHMTLVETDAVALDVLVASLAVYAGQITPVYADATRWITEQPDACFDAFTASWAVHNFPSSEREQFLKEVARVLKPGGLCVLFDKILPDDDATIRALWETHTKRLDGLDAYGKTALKEEMLEHERRDAAEPYVWHEAHFMHDMEAAGFHDVRITMRNERDAVAVAVR